jgi:hypothetical protein
MFCVSFEELDGTGSASLPRSALSVLRACIHIRGPAHTRNIHTDFGFARQEPLHDNGMCIVFVENDDNKCLNFV